MTLSKFNEIFAELVEFETPASFCSQRRMAAFHLRGAGLSEVLAISIAKCTSRKNGLLVELPKALTTWFNYEKQVLEVSRYNLEQAEMTLAEVNLRIEIGQNLIASLA